LPKDKTHPSGAASSSRLLSLMVSRTDLCDEGYFQLAKQTRSNPNEACLRRTRELFVIVTSNVPATQKAEKGIRAHIYQTCRDVSSSATRSFQIRTDGEREQGIQFLRPDKICLRQVRGPRHHRNG
jgi:hypothetical protein